MIRRVYEAAASAHLATERQMLFLSGPRQVGKTTVVRQLAATASDSTYLTWDNADHRRVLLAGAGAIASHAGLDRMLAEPPLCVFDEIHKYSRWKDLLKGVFDTWERAVRIVVTGSARLDVFRRGGDSLAGRYFPYRLHPFSLAELLAPALRDAPLNREPRAIEDDQFEALERFGGFPEPFVRAEARFWNRWQRLRVEQLLLEDVRDLTRVQEASQVTTLAEVLRHQPGGLVSYTSLANAVASSVDSARRWLKVLEALYVVFTVRPWVPNVARSLRKEPKAYLWDWSRVDDPGMRAENLVASALLKAVHFWTDHGFGAFDLHFIRDKEKREVDFLVSRDAKPWFLVEVKRSGNAPLSPHLARFQEALQAEHAFQVAFDLPFVERDCFEETRPIIVPARTFLAQLV